MKHFAPLQRLLKKRKDVSMELVKKAYIVAHDAHEGQTRKAGGPYITHPVSVAVRIAKIDGDQESIIAALLHDTVEDTPVTLSKIKKEFGKEIAFLVDGLTKLNKGIFRNEDFRDEHIETIRKWLIAINCDLRVAVIKLMDRIDNLESLAVFRREKQERIAQQTLDVYAPVAQWLSLQDIRKEIEEICLSYVLPKNDFAAWKKTRKACARKTHRIIDHIENIVQKELSSKTHPTFGVCPVSPKNSYFSSSEGSPNSVAFPLVVHCVVDTPEQCYEMLGFFHQHWKRRQETFEDFINIPKLNGYKGIHTSLILEKGEEVEVRILTKKMFEYHRKGITLLCFDDAKRDVITLPWADKMQKLIHTNSEKSLEFWEGIKSDLLEGFIVG